MVVVPVLVSREIAALPAVDRPGRAVVATLPAVTPAEPGAGQARMADDTGARDS